MPVTRTCEVCGAVIPARGGRPARYCSDTCRQRGFRRREPGPATLDDFVGREHDLKRLRALSRSSRLVTLIGPGGVGKTRLATEFAQQATLVELDSVAQAEQLPRVVARAFGVGELDAMIQAVGTRKVLLVLDNCEHLVEPCAHLLDVLLRRCPGLRVVATSREALRVPGEVVYRVGELSLPAEGTEDRATLLRSDAVRLFLDRATAADPGLELTTGNAAVVAEICRRLDGLPLAIELAARRAGTLPFEQILAGLDDQLALLTDGARTAPARHRELEAAIEWSHRLLGPRERAVFRRLSVLAGGFDLAGAAAVCGDIPSVLRLVCNLEAKSLLTRVPGTARFRQLNPIRAYASDRLAASGELAGTQDRAADWLVSVAGPVGGTLILGEVLRRDVGEEQENLAAAVEFTARDGGDRHLVLAVGLVRCWYQQGHLTAGRRLLADVLDRAGDSELRGDALALAAVLASLQGDHAEGMRLAGQAVRVARHDDCPDGLANALDAHALALLGGGEQAAAVDAYRECLRVVGALGRPLDAAICRNRLAWALLQTGDPGAAAGLIVEAVRVLRADGPSLHLAAALHTEGAVRLHQWEWAAAEAVFSEALGTCQLDGKRLMCHLEGLAIVASAKGSPRRALRLFAAGSELGEQQDVRPEAYWQRVVDEARARARARCTDAGAAAATAAGRRLRGESLVAYALGDDPQPGPLTRRELEVAALVAEGSTNREIAARLDVSVGTVATHLNSIRDKLGVRSRIRIALWMSGVS